MNFKANQGYKKFMARVKIADNFDIEEFTCPCCGEIILSPRFFDHICRLDMMRNSVGFPIHVNSGHRCEKHNAEVGGVKDSQHRDFATDIRPEDGDPHKLDIMYQQALALGFSGIGRYKTFIHIDMREGSARWNG